ncbi:MAG: phosphatidate cytidylyltransferase [Peptostreptococcaceae bacterium]|nr:phosphatidate cytidylyltransferase [uncultured Criibacterium sp.]MBS6062295.1 phosphatidate cytidylyltransferase [Peptostreptococcaceae bacterium]
MKTRVISALILLPPLIFVLVKGDFLLAFLAMIASLIAIYEFTNAIHVNIDKNEKYILYFVTILNMAVLYIKGQNHMLSIVFLLLLLEGFLVVSDKVTPNSAAYTMFTYVYISLPLASIYAISKYHGDFFWYIFIFSMVTDTMAYFSGYIFGKHKLSPKLSPKKTIEGAIGGVIGCTLASVVYATYFHKDMILPILIFSIFGSLVAQVGDIFASAFKRWTGIKDYANLIPGHGGILDRTDSISFSTLYVFIIAQLF